MPRYKLTLEYDGRPYVGWQRQANGGSVQQALEEAFQRFCGQTLVVHGAGRTDAGVHASGQVAHVTLDRTWRTDVVRDAVNAHVRPHPIAILSAEQVADDFDARFSATQRHYVYRIINRRADLTLARGLAWHVRRRLDAQAMHEAAQLLVGRYDFSTFRDSECQANSPVRTLERLDVVREGDRIDIHVSALSFLHRQVRSMVGSLEHVGSGKWRADDLRAALKARDRARCGQVAPADGLYLTQVDYGDLNQLRQQQLADQIATNSEGGEPA
jgi:tRNA pseudouridine38-40 synthase